MKNLLSQCVPATDDKIFDGIYSTEEDFIKHYNEICTPKSILPEWALKQIFCWSRTYNPVAIAHEDHSIFLREFFVTHRGAAMDCFFENIIHQDTSSGQCLIYVP